MLNGRDSGKANVGTGPKPDVSAIARKSGMGPVCLPPTLDKGFD